MNPKLRIASVIFAASFFIGLFAARAQSPYQNPTSQGGDAPISMTSSSGQAKLGGLSINANNLSQIGLLIRGNPVTGTGRLTIATPGFTPPGGASNEQVEVQGNLRISGLIKPEGDAGAPRKALERTLTDPLIGEQITWEGRGWLTIMGGWSPDFSCTGSSPRLCAAFGLREYGIYCFAAAPGYSAWARVCRE